MWLVIGAFSAVNCCSLKNDTKKSHQNDSEESKIRYKMDRKKVHKHENRREDACRVIKNDEVEYRFWEEKIGQLKVIKKGEESEKRRKRWKFKMMTYLWLSTCLKVSNVRTVLLNSTIDRSLSANIVSFSWRFLQCHVV